MKKMNYTELTQFMYYMNPVLRSKMMDAFEVTVDREVSQIVIIQFMDSVENYGYEVAEDLVEDDYVTIRFERKEEA